jgi:hypothetical protein
LTLKAEQYQPGVSHVVVKSSNFGSTPLCAAYASPKPLPGAHLMISRNLPFSRSILFLFAGLMAAAGCDV